MKILQAISPIKGVDRKGFPQEEIGLCVPGTRLQVFPTYINLKILNTPLKGFFVSGEEDVEPVSFDCSASVENFHGLAVAIAGNEHFGVEGISSVRRDKGIARQYLVPAGCYSI